nr:glycoside hydrolase family 18 protein [uncultured Eisenbergiella sp.]
MKKHIIHSLVAAAVLLLAGTGMGAKAAPAKTDTGNLVVGYYTNWSSDKGYTPADIPANKLTHLNYAFAKIDPAVNTIAMANPEKDIKNFEQLRALKKKNPALKTLISVGGWDYSTYFSTIAATEESRNQFASGCLTFMLTHGFDGIDLDWEYPVSGGPAGNMNSPEDKQNFTLLLSAIRNQLNAQSLRDGKKYYLTIAGAANSSYLNKIEPLQVAGLVDYIFVMAYDMHGPWDTYSDLGAPLYNPAEESPQYKNSVQNGIQAYLNAGVAAGKLVLGMPFYGYLYEGTAAEREGRYSTFSKARALGYDAIKRTYLNNPAFSSFFHEGAMVPYLYGNGAFLSYENPRSITAKAAFAGNAGLAGVGIWELSHDSGGELLESARAGLAGA